MTSSIPSTQVKQHSFFRNLGSRSHNWMANLVLDKPADIYLSSFNTMSRFVAQEIVKHTGPAPYIDAIILRSTRKIGKITVHHQSRTQGKSGYTLLKLVSLWGNMFVSYSLYPIRILIVLGIILSVLGFYEGFTTLSEHFLPGGETSNDLDRLAALSAFFRGIQLLATGLVGEYVGRIFLHINHDPQYIVRNLSLSNAVERRSSHRRCSDHVNVTHRLKHQRTEHNIRHE